jgi:hypothetical protein
MYSLPWTIPLPTGICDYVLFDFCFIETKPAFSVLLLLESDEFMNMKCTANSFVNENVLQELKNVHA